MSNPDRITDRAILALLAERLAGYRLRQNLTQAALAKEAGISKLTVLRIERGESTQVTNLVRVLRALGLIGNLDAFIPPLTLRPLEQARLKSRPRQRASRRSEKKPAPPAGGWQWKEDVKKSGDKT
ncbi:MAG: helix-turn-helix transcriptional regulator [Phycisphaerales bacterium]|nr:helix-turn-helix transcriptional regulator [Phycisphaerales bacterium]